MQRNAQTHEITDPKPKATQSTRKGDSMRSFVTSAPERVIIGIESRKETRAAASRVYPKSNPAVIVIPEREVPGINATA